MADTTAVSFRAGDSENIYHEPQYLPMNDPQPRSTQSNALANSTFDEHQPKRSHGMFRGHLFSTVFGILVLLMLLAIACIAILLFLSSEEKHDEILSEIAASEEKGEILEEKIELMSQKLEEVSTDLSDVMKYLVVDPNYRTCIEDYHRFSSFYSNQSRICYFHINQGMTYDDAENACKANLGQIATPANDQEMATVHELTRNPVLSWSGFRRSSNGSSWETGEGEDRSDFLESYWMGAQPGQEADCVYFHYTAHWPEFLAVMNCDVTTQVLCERRFLD